LELPNTLFLQLRRPFLRILAVSLDCFQAILKRGARFIVNTASQPAGREMNRCY
jgi:hypothetical protein